MHEEHWHLQKPVSKSAHAHNAPLPSFPPFLCFLLLLSDLMPCYFPSTGIPPFPFSSSLLPASHPLASNTFSLFIIIIFSITTLSFSPSLWADTTLTVLLLMRARVRLWLHRWDDIMSHNLSFTSQRARAGRRLTHQSLCRRTEEFNNLLQPSGFVAERRAIATGVWCERAGYLGVNSTTLSQRSLVQCTQSEHIQTVLKNVCDVPSVYGSVLRSGGGPPLCATCETQPAPPS